ncbi:MAG TPA: prolipoprotein diacylglyceryl transferase [Xanthomonadaceae bacterium]|nr:prolipoprotein diacylglyceryl transferase [Xanthomonadaceae bacterium]
MSRPFLHDINPVAVPLGIIDIHWYGLMYLLSFGLAWWLGRRRLGGERLPGVKPAAFDDLMFWGMLGLIVGGRLGYVLFYAFGDFLRDPLMLVRLQQGGMSFHGGLLGGMAALWWWSRRQSVVLFDAFDFVVPLVPIGLGLGRIGNFIGGELWGRHTELPWGVIFPGALNLDPSQVRALYEAGLLDHEARHPSQLYQAGLEGLVLFVALMWFTRRPRPRYAASGLFLLLYGVFRFAVEFVREPDAHIGFIAFGWLTMGQLLSLPLVVLGVFLLWWARRSRAAAFPE